jgi:8-oxo-dGTP pyrophosphatase MutT (NUDIX family)
MTIKAAGILFLTPDNKALFLKRGPGGDYPGFWCFPGGQRESDETAEETAKREAVEEIGKLPKGDRMLLARSITKGGLAQIAAVGTAGPPGSLPGEPKPGEDVDFTTLVQEIDSTFEPTLGPKEKPEHVGYAWAPANQPPEPLHPGCKIALARLTMNELDIARAIADGALTSPQYYKNMALVALRITGTGTAYRNKSKEFVYRKPEEFLNDDFLARCNGLTVIMIHPPKDILDSKEFAKRKVGSIMLPFIRNDEVWGVARIYDDAAMTLLENYQLSTSPGVLVGKDSRLVMIDNQRVLIEGKPELLDHIAILPPGLNGVWDKGEGPMGVESVSANDDVDGLSIRTSAVNATLDAALALFRSAQVARLFRRLDQ